MKNVVSKEKTGKMIRKTADRLGWSVSDIAHATGVSRSVVYQWLNGTKLPTLGNLYLLSRCFNCPMAYLIKVNPTREWERG